MLRSIAVIIAVIFGLSITDAALHAQDEPVPPYATAFDIEQQVGNSTMRILWAAADENSIEIAWLTTFDRSKTSTWRWNSVITANGQPISPYFDGGEAAPRTQNIESWIYIFRLSPSGIHDMDEITLEIRYEGVDLAGSTDGTPLPGADTDTVVFTLVLPFYNSLYWYGEQTVMVNGIPITLKGVEYSPVESFFTLCYPRIRGQSGRHRWEMDPFIDDPVYASGGYGVGQRPVWLAHDLWVAQTEFVPEATDEMGVPIYPSPMPEPTPSPEKCIDFGVKGLRADADGVLRLTIDELRSPPLPTAENIGPLNIAFEQAGLPYRVEFDMSGGFGARSSTWWQTHPRLYEYRVYSNLVSDFTSERILGPWVFEVALNP